jgi:hypothetical protein
MNEPVKRAVILAYLYRQRQANPGHGWVSRADLLALAPAPDFALDVLSELQHIELRGLHCRITAGGAIAHETTTEGA